MSLDKLVFGKACHLPVELEHRALSALRQLNLDMEITGTRKVIQLHELDEFRSHAFESTRLYKERMKIMHPPLPTKRLKLFSGKLKSRWSGPFRVVEMHPARAVEIASEDGSRKFKVNRQSLKYYQGMVGEDKVISTMYLKDP
uniref:Uncharacterized protein n=1 Tax=Nicotiana tabacum TaxID=4097 RepID=A0A1S3XUV4_TOBAC|nr:PREDICTED: uncharacterized protein LOC107768993 [Nicotiana tabacum]